MRRGEKRFEIAVGVISATFVFTVCFGWMKGVAMLRGQGGDSEMMGFGGLFKGMLVMFMVEICCLMVLISSSKFEASEFTKAVRKSFNSMSSEW
jgi:hypothetical protein